MMRQPKHDLTFIAFTRNEDDTLSVIDIIETASKYAGRFWRQLNRDPLVCAIEVCPPHRLNGLKGRRFEVRP